jgi:predicted transcriptional regulator
MTVHFNILCIVHQQKNICNIFYLNNGNYSVLSTVQWLIFEWHLQNLKEEVMATILEMAVEIVAAHASTTNMSKEELIGEIASVYQALSALDKGDAVAAEAAQTESGPAISKKKAFGKDQVFCMICGKGMKTLTRHIKTAHTLTPGQYRKQFGIPRSQSLAARNYSESRRQMAIDRGLGEKLAKAREARGKAKSAAPAKAPAKPTAKTRKK